MKLDAKRLNEACSDTGSDAGITFFSALDPLAGPGAPVKPAIYEGGVYQLDRRWVGEGDDRRAVDAIVIDNVPSQANRLEAALELLAPELGLPNVVLDLTEIGQLPPHLPERLSGFRFPHRQADAYLRDSLLDGEPFAKTEIGKAVTNATADDPEVILQWFPQALLYGFWQSHLGKKRSQAKLARSWVSEIVGYEPASDTVSHKLGVKGDPLNLSVDEDVFFDDNDVAGWTLSSDKATKGTKKKTKLSEIGHGQVPFPSPNRPAANLPVSFKMIEQRATGSLASLRRIHFGDDEKNSTARALLLALGLVAHTAAFGQVCNLRSECDLRTASSSVVWLGATADTEITGFDLAAAKALFADCVAAAKSAGLPVGAGNWQGEPLVLRPNESLAKAIRATYPALD